MGLLDVLAPRALSTKRMRRVSLKAHIGHRIETGDFLAAVIPQTLESIAQCFFLVEFEDMLLESLKIVQLRLAVLPLALERLVLRSAVCNAW